MGNISVSYKLTFLDFHKAFIFATITMHRIGFRILALTGLVALACYVGALFELMPLIMIPAYIFFGYFVWALYVFAKMEHNILKYSKNPQSLLMKEINLTVKSDSFEVATPHNNKKWGANLANMFFAFELSDMFLLYIDGAETIIIPYHSITPHQRKDIRERLQESMHERFSTRFGYASYAQPKKGFFGR